MGRFGIQAVLQFIQNPAEVFQGNLAAVFAQDFDEPAHVGPLVIMGQVHVHIDAGHRLLGAVFLVPDGDGIADVLDPHLVDIDIAVVFLALDVNHFLDAG